MVRLSDEDQWGSLIWALHKHGKLMFDEGDIVLRHGRMFDMRTRFDGERGIYVVKPIGRDCGYYAYCCPVCGKVQFIHCDDARLDVPAPCGDERPMVDAGKSGKRRNKRAYELDKIAK